MVITATGTSTTSTTSAVTSSRTSHAAAASSKLLLVPFQRLVERRSFAKVQKVLIEVSDDEKLRTWLEDDDNHTVGKSKEAHAFASLMFGETPLHRLAAVRPPVDLVAILIQRMTAIYKNAPLDATDALGRTPLHVAAARGSAEIIRLLTYGCPGQSMIVTATLFNDIWLRSPLHWACSHTKEVTNRTVLQRIFMLLFSVKTTDMVGAVQVLIEAYPEAVLLRDRDGRTPVTLAIENDADPRIVHLVFQAAIKMSPHCSKDEEMDSVTSYLRDESMSTPDGFPNEVTVYTTTTATKSTSQSKSRSTRYVSPRVLIEL